MAWYFVRHEKCHRYYYSGWKPLCADCGEPIEWWNIYMSREAAETIQYMDLGSEENPVTYYYLCPFVVIWNRELHFHHTDVRQSQTISIGLPMMQMLSPAMALWKKAIICMIMLYFMREKK